ncbi:MAG: nucleotide exchange factor GrpE [Desulfobacteraceae bacterium 4572_87]|nr:MAG: nucleotide exchange factor GrpE [Desulfobacteraceae bacterium 4572_87]
MAKINVMDEEKSVEGLSEEVDIAEEGDLGLEDEPQNEKEIPLSDMTQEQLIEKVSELQALADRNMDSYLRSQAEMENMKKRFQKDKQDLRKFGNETLTKQLIPVADNLEMALDHSKDENSIEALREGVDLTLKGLLNVLEKAGVELVEAVGAAFDPNFHEAVSEQKDDRAEPGTVLKELQKGYLLNKRLIRPAMVIVNKK